MTAATCIRDEPFLGPVRCVVLDDQQTGSRVVSVSYELNVIDGWVCQAERTDESGMTWEPSSPGRKSRVGEVLDAAPECLDFIATSQVLWIQALLDAGMARHAAAQRRALEEALHRHGQALTSEVRKMLDEYAATARQAREDA